MKQLCDRGIPITALEMKCIKGPRLANVPHQPLSIQQPITYTDCEVS